MEDPVGAETQSVPMNGADNFNPAISDSSAPNWPRAGIDMLVADPANVPSRFVASMLTVTAAEPAFEITTPDWIDPASRAPKLPESSAYNRNELAEAIPPI